MTTPSACEVSLRIQLELYEWELNLCVIVDLPFLTIYVDLHDRAAQHGTLSLPMRGANDPRSVCLRYRTAISSGRAQCTSRTTGEYSSGSKSVPARRSGATGVTAPRRMNRSIQIVSPYPTTELESTNSYVTNEQSAPQLRGRGMRKPEVMRQIRAC
jgi:hypothetical protein